VGTACGLCPPYGYCSYSTRRVGKRLPFAHAGPRPYDAATPPSIDSTDPCTKRASSEAR
jgi:peptidoglycan/xylan/chitin deacetylase (PgdA/CDA1 family)